MIVFCPNRNKKQIAQMAAEIANINFMCLLIIAQSKFIIYDRLLLLIVKVLIAPESFSS